MRSFMLSEYWAIEGSRNGEFREETRETNQFVFVLCFTLPLIVVVYHHEQH